MVSKQPNQMEAPMLLMQQHPMESIQMSFQKL